MDGIPVQSFRRRPDNLNQFAAPLGVFHQIDGRKYPYRNRHQKRQCCNHTPY